MKKAMRKLMCVALVVLLVACMTVPAMAASGTGNAGGYNYTYTITRGDTEGVAQITTSAAPAEVRADVYNQFYYDLMDRQVQSWGGTSTGYVTTTATDDNLVYVDNVLVRAQITCTCASFKVAGWWVAENIYEGYYIKNLEMEVIPDP